MPQKPSDLDPSANALAFFGAELRHYRGLARMSQGLLGERVHYSGTLIGQIETGKRMPSADLAARCDEELGTGGVLARLWPLVSKETYPSWFRPFVELEHEATSLREFAPLGVPGLLQNEDYARALFKAGRPAATTAQVDELVAARMERQAILWRDHPPMLWVVFDESSLRRPIGSSNGGAKVMSAQLDSLADAAKRSRVVVQVVPMSAGEHVGLTGGFTIASFADAPDVAYLDTVLHGQVVDRAAEVTECTTLFSMLQSVALSPEASLDLIAGIRKES